MASKTVGDRPAMVICIDSIKQGSAAVLNEKRGERGRPLQGGGGDEWLTVEALFQALTLPLYFLFQD